MADSLNTGLSAQQVLTAFDRALNDYTDAEIDALLGSKQDSISDLSEIRSGAAAGATAVQPAEFEADQQRQDALEAEDRAALIAQVDGGAKNLLRNTASSQVVGGVTFTVNADGTIIANGTKTNNDWLYLSMGNTLPAGSYVLSSGLDPQENSSVRVLVTTADSLGAAIMGTEGQNQVVAKTFSQSYSGLIYAIRISSGYTASNIVLKPMLCTAADYAISTAFVPYAPTNRELYEMILALQNGA